MIGERKAVKKILIRVSTVKKAVLSLAILVSFCLIFAVSCGNNTQAPSGALPILRVGDTWTMKASNLGVEYTIVDTVTGKQVYNGINCYIVTRQISTKGASTTMDIIGPTIFMVDKTTLDIVGREIPTSRNGIIDTVIGNATYNYSIKPYPLNVGKTWTVTDNMTVLGGSAGQNQTTTQTYIYTYKVEAVESITVPAGTFQCLKIVQYDSNNSILNTRWVTDITGVSAVKIIDSLGMTSELTSYSLSK